MIAMDWDRIAMEFTRRRLEQFGSKIRRATLMKAANAASVPMLAAVKDLISTEQEADNIPQNTGQLAKSIGKKVNAYAAGNRVFVGAGPRRGFRATVTEYRDYRTGQMRKWLEGQPKSGPKVQNPTHYAHLAGKGRRGLFRNRAARDCKNAVVKAFEASLIDEVSQL